MVNPDRNLYEPPYDDALLYDSDLEPERPRSRPLVVLLGIVVLAAFAGVVWVAYNQGVKQGQNGTPVLTADSGPTRIVPATGGPSVNEPAPEKSYDRLPGLSSGDAEANMAPGPEEPRPVTSSPQDIATTPPAASVSPTEFVGGKFGDKATDFDPPVDPRMDATTGSLSTAPKQVEDLTPALAPESATPPSTAPRSLAPKSSPVNKPATVTQATPPAPRPSATAAQGVGPKVITTEPPLVPATPPQTKIAALPPAEEPVPAPKAATAKGIQIQLGSFPSDSLAATSWSKIKSANQDLLGSYSPAFERAEIPGKGTWYRLRVGGFSDRTAAADVCEALKANGQACIIASK